jgi:hypothetical protein
MLTDLAQGLGSCCPGFLTEDVDALYVQVGSTVDGCLKQHWHDSHSEMPCSFCFAWSFLPFPGELGFDGKVPGRGPVHNGTPAPE